MIKLSTLISAFGEEVREKYSDRLLPGHLRALQAWRSCRTEKSPVFIAKCRNCRSFAVYPHSCGHRSCPHCQHQEGQRWLERQRRKLLPVDYFMVTFTLPAQLRSVLWRHQRLGYDLLIKLAWKTLRSFGLNDSKLKGNIGAHAVLHTHSRRLDYHPHVHFIVPAGAVNQGRRLWRQKKGKYLFKQENLAVVFRARWLEAMNLHGLKVKATLPKDWVVDSKHVGRGDKALTYLGKYLYRGVLQEKDILTCENGRVTFRYTENSGKRKTRTLPGADFLWLLLQHVLPRRFRRSRDFGFLHSNCKKIISLLHLLFGRPPFVESQLRKAPIVCKACGGIMAIMATRIGPSPKIPAFEGL